MVSGQQSAGGPIHMAGHCPPPLGHRAGEGHKAGTSWQMPPRPCGRAAPGRGGQGLGAI